ncbi:MAG: hypothetical protein II998_12935 [Clostridia bacterium]|nr:hypothetical protein [Clostridia bacterium]
MKKIVSAKEITDNPTHKSIIFFINSSAAIGKSRILAYLKSFKEATACNCDKPATDVISGKIINEKNIYYSDGEYLWSKEEIYYVEKYNLMPDYDFLKKIGIDGKEKYRARKINKHKG